MRKLIAAPAVHFKGSGWAKKDRSATAVPGTSQAQKETSEKATSEKAPAKESPAKAATAEPASGGGSTAD